MQVNSSLENEHYEHLQRSRVLLSVLVTSLSARVTISLATVTIRRISTGWHYPIFWLSRKGLQCNHVVTSGVVCSCMFAPFVHTSNANRCFCSRAWMKRTDPSYPIKSKRMVLPAREGFHRNKQMLAQPAQLPSRHWPPYGANISAPRNDASPPPAIA